MASGKKLPAGKKAMFREALSKQAKGKPNHTKMTNIPKPKKQEDAPDLEGDYSRAPKPKKGSKKKTTKANVPH